MQQLFHIGDDAIGTFILQVADWQVAGIDSVGEKSCGFGGSYAERCVFDDAAVGFRELCALPCGEIGFG